MKLNEIQAQPQAVMLIGLPGSGKSTWIKKFLSGKNPDEWVIASTDDILEKWGKEKGLSYNQAFATFNFREVKGQMMADIQNAIKDQKNIIFDQTNMNKKARREKLALLPKNYVKNAVVFSIPDPELKSRLSKREKETGKSIPAHVIDSMARSYEAPDKGEFDKIVFVK